MHDGHLFLRTIKLMIRFDAEIGHRRCFFIILAESFSTPYFYIFSISVHELSNFY